jgi:DNA-binding MltR family transcriptional regulator
MIKRRKPPIKVEELSADSARFVRDLQRETDRGVALAGAAFVADALRALINAAFVNDIEIAERLLDGERPLGTMSARIDIAYALGLIGPDMRRQANILRQIRNSFAHEHQPADLAAPGLKSAVDGLRIYLKPLERLENANPRSVVVMTIILLTNHLLLRALSTRHVAFGDDFRVTNRPVPTTVTKI